MDYPEGHATGNYYSFLFIEGANSTQLNIPAGELVLIAAAPLRNGALELKEMQRIDIGPGQDTVNWMPPPRSSYNGHSVAPGFRSMV